MGRLLRYKYLPHLLTALFLVTEGISAWLVWANYQRNHQAYIEKNTREFDIGLTATLHHFEEVAESVMIIPQGDDNLEPAVSALRLFADTTGGKADEATGLLEKMYVQLVSRGFKGFSVVDEHGMVLIRMHNPTFRGDSISTLLPLIQQAALTRQPVTGFHAGGSAAGYCVVFAIKCTDNQTRFILLTIDNVALQQEMKKIFPYEYVFLINKESVLQTTPYPMLSGYHFSDLSVDYFYEKSDREINPPGMKQYIAQSEIVLFNKINKREIESGLMKNKPFGLNAKTENGKSYTGLFFPVTGPDNKPAAFIISYSSDATLSDYRKDTLIIFSVSSLLIIIAFAFILFSIHTFRRLSEKNIQLAESEKQLQELNVAKDKFFSIIAHDLRNPFHGLVGLAEVLTEDFDSMPAEKTRKFHQLIYESSRHGYQLVNNLLEWTRMQTGRMVFQPEKISLSRLIEEVTAQSQSTLEAKQLTLKTALTPGIQVKADYPMASAILRNLLSNAVKFSFPGNVIMISTSISSAHAHISVTDQGIGMDKKAIEGLWRIEQSHSSKGTSGESGTGLGLILVKEFVERNNGTISVKSEPGKGSTFTFTLPMF